MVFLRGSSFFFKKPDRLILKLDIFINRYKGRKIKGGHFHRKSMSRSIRPTTSSTEAARSSTWAVTAFSGQAAMQCPHPLQADALYEIFSSSRVLAPIKQAVTHFPQALHFFSSVLICRPFSFIIESWEISGRCFTEFLIAQQHPQQKHTVRSFPRSFTPQR